MKPSPKALSFSKRNLNRLISLLIAGARHQRRARSSEEKRLAAQISLTAVIEFMQSVDETAGTDVCSPLLAVLNALHDLDDGKVATILLPTKRSSRPPDESRIRNLRAASAATLEFLISIGFGAEESARDIFHAVQSCGIPIGSIRNETPGAKTVMGWRNNIKSRSPKKSRRSLGNNAAHIASDDERYTFEVLLQSFSAQLDLPRSVEKQQVLHAFKHFLVTHCLTEKEKLY